MVAVEEVGKGRPRAADQDVDVARAQAVELLPERQLDVVEAAAGVERELLEVGVAGAAVAAVLRAREEAGRRRVADAVDRHGGAGRQSGGEEKEEREECAEKLAHVERHTISNKVEHLSYISRKVGGFLPIDKGKENAYNEIINPEYFYKDSRGRASGS